MPSRVISDTDGLDAVYDALFKLLLGDKKRPLTVSWVAGEDRSRAQNRLAHRWFSEIGKQTGETPDEVKARAKLDIGCPILCAADAYFNDRFIDAVQPLPREIQLDLMRPDIANGKAMIDVTSLMTVKQMQEFLDTFERQHRTQGLYLSHPDDRGRE